MMGCWYSDSGGNCASWNRSWRRCCERKDDWSGCCCSPDPPLLPLEDSGPDSMIHGIVHIDDWNGVSVTSSLTCKFNSNRMSDAGPYDAIQALCRELNELCLSVNIVAPEDRDDLTPDQLREGLEALAQQVAKEANRFVVVLLTTTVDHDGAEFLAQSVLSKAHQFLSCAQLYLRYFGRPLREQLGNHVRCVHCVESREPPLRISNTRRM